MAKTLRVHHLAKELGVASKEIVAKCNAEGVQPPLKNHMAAVSLGLAESIREWFSTGDDVTTIEVASPVNLEKVKKPRTRKAQQAEEGAAVASAENQAQMDAPGVAVAAPPDAETVEPVPELESQPEIVRTEEAIAAEKVEVVTPASPEESEASTTDEVAASAVEPEEATEVELTVEGATETVVMEPPAEVLEEKQEEEYQEPPPPPEPIMPAGPQMVPKAPALKGPRVIRIEAPEPIRQPRPRPRPSPRPSGPRPVVPGDVAALAERELASRGRGPGAPAGGRGKKGAGAGAGAGHSRSPRRRAGSVELSTERLKEWRDQDLIERKERLASATGHGVKARRSAERNRRTGTPAQIARRTEVEITVPIGAKDFCSAIGTPFNVVFTKISEHTGQICKITDMINAETAELVAMELGITLILKHARTAFETLVEEFANRERNNLKPRPPVVAMLGHVDHGKTSLLDAIRKTDVVAGEAGGITQHIGAYQVKREGWNVTFLDTPGHEAFTAMRARGANMTDVVVLVVAADDGVMPQTREAINHAKAAGVQIVVALNKIDLPGVDLNRIYAQLAEHELAPAEWGGETDVVKTSATTGQGIDELIAHLSTLSELMSLNADPDVPTQGSVIEAQMREGRGVGVQILVREGTLKVGQVVVCGPGAGRVRSLLDHRGKRIKQAGPGTPVEVVGLDELPESGETLYQVDSLPDAKRIAEEIRIKRREEALTDIRKPQTLEELFSGASEEEVPELNVIVKADVQGSVDVLKASLGQFPSDKAKLRILHAGVGVISEADVELARASKAVLIGFHVVADDHARQLAEQCGVEIRLYRVIYNVHDDLHKALEGLLEPELHEEARGKVEVRQVFSISRVGRIAGCFVSDGIVARNHRVRLVRDGRVIVEGNPINSLRRFKDDAREVRAGLECGVKIEGYDDLKPGDIIETYEIVEVAQTL